MTPHMMAEWRAGGIYFEIRMSRCGHHLEYPADRAWQQFLDVLTGQTPSASCPTLDELQISPEEKE